MCLFHNKSISPFMTIETTLSFIDNAVALANPERYLSVTVEAGIVLESWKSSLYSFEWLRPDKTIKAAAELNDSERAKREAVEAKIKQGGPLSRPVLGIGMLDNIEIGAGRAEFLTLCAMGARYIPVHIPKSNESDFKAFIARL